MKAVVAALVLAACASVAWSGDRTTFQGQGTIEVAFAPWDDIEDAVVRAVDGARKQILVQAFSFTSRRIAKALVAARARGVDVQVTVDREQAFAGEGSRIAELVAAGIPVWMEVRYQSAHNKVIVIDSDTSTPVLVTGSANWTSAAARKNAENVLILRNNHALTRAYAANWQRHRADALPYGRQ